MKKSLLALMTAAAVGLSGAAFAAESLTAAELDGVTAGTYNFQYKQYVQSKVDLNVKARTDIKGNQHKAVATSLATATVPAGTASFTITDGYSVVDPYKKVWESYASSESVGGVQVYYPKH